MTLEAIEAISSSLALHRKEREQSRTETEPCVNSVRQLHG